MLCAACLLIPPGQVVARPRDPWVFRAVFEDRPRQLIIGLGAPGRESPLWMVFHPETGAPRKVWRGQVDLRGKVYDFSQQNSRAEGKVLYAAPDELLTLPTGGNPGPGWRAEGATYDAGWRFPTSTSRLVSPEISNASWQRTYIAFDEYGDQGRLEIQLLDARGKVVEWFQSSNTVLGPNVWQWNYKQIQTHASPFRISAGPAAGSKDKRFRNLRVFGDFPAWFVGDNPAAVHFLGYNVDGTKSVSVRTRVGEAEIAWSPEITAGGWTETLTLSGRIPPGGLVWRRNQVGQPVDLEPGNHSRSPTAALRFTAAGTYKLTFRG